MVLFSTFSTYSSTRGLGEDFLDFKDEIKKEFGVIVVDLMDLRQFAKDFF